MKLFTRRDQAEAQAETAAEATPAQTVSAFLTAFGSLDVEAALSVVDDSARVDIHPTGLREGGPADLRAFLTETATAFPDLLVTVKNLIETGSVVTAELKVEGTQAAGYLGAINQEKHLDVDQAWRFTVSGDRITGVDAYWCQNQLYRRLAVKRLDQISLV
ncbi:nuclear transport factor 2 family protein [Amycolatopsis sp. NBC_01488]|uniref:nuclear transport factor 2 family protein n=1 Tax=Amycolatopsis sp. NBC_01488 TaxID=2903563 RepID=UPI002E2AAEFC|nr:nuclear transport factor 2 family protein [Amycolatopsis sp. NBC_01488]